MKAFEWGHIQSLGAGPRFIDNPVERECPACGNAAVRTYMYRSDRPGRETVISYTWCAVCRRFSGSTGPRPGRLDFADPLRSLSSGEREEMESDTDRFFETLDRMWESGLLPQQFNC